MKQLIVQVKPFVAEAVLRAVADQPIIACIVDEVKGHGRQKSYLDRYLGSEYSSAFLPKVEISLWVDDEQVEATAKDVVAAARTGRMGDGKVLILDAAWSDPIEF